MSSAGSGELGGRRLAPTQPFAPGLAAQLAAASASLKAVDALMADQAKIAKQLAAASASMKPALDALTAPHARIAKQLAASSSFKAARNAAAATNGMRDVIAAQEKALKPTLDWFAAQQAAQKPLFDHQERLARSLAVAYATRGIRGVARVMPARRARERAPRRTARVRRPQRQRAPTGDPPRHADRAARRGGSP